MSRRSRKSRRQALAPIGVVAIDKPVGPTSREALAEVQRRLGIGSSGHCGTLDPLASGLILVCTGMATRVQDLLMGQAKEYRAEIALGRTSASGDAEGPIEDVAPDGPAPSLADVAAARDRFLGEIDQVPPLHSAIRVDGERLHVRARRGETDVVVPVRRVHIDAIEIESYAWPKLLVRVVCGPGTYVRSLARDLGEALGCGAYLAGLRRTRSGATSVEGAVAPAAVAPRDVRPLEDVLAEHPRIDVAEGDLDALLAGRPVVPESFAPARIEGEGERVVWWRDRVLARGVLLPDGLARMRRMIVDPRAGAPSS